MTGFSVEKLKVESADGLNFTLLEEFTYTAKNGDVITVTAGTTSDGASTPRALWLTKPPFGTYWKSAYLHDYLYRYSDKPKDYCDSMFLEAMNVLDVNFFIRDELYEGVHLFGWSSFDGDRKAQKK